MGKDLLDHIGGVAAVVLLLRKIFVSFLGTCTPQLAERVLWIDLTQSTALDAGVMCRLRSLMLLRVWSVEVEEKGSGGDARLEETGSGGSKPFVGFCPSTPLIKCRASGLPIRREKHIATPFNPNTMEYTVTHFGE
jgi:hypothetical protein